MYYNNNNNNNNNKTRTISRVVYVGKRYIRVRFITYNNRNQKIDDKLIDIPNIYFYNNV